MQDITLGCNAKNSILSQEVKLITNLKYHTIGINGGFPHTFRTTVVRTVGEELRGVAAGTERKE